MTVIALIRSGKLGLCRSIAISLMVSIAGCNSGKSLQNTLAPDPKLKQPVAESTKVAATEDRSTNTLPTDFPIYPQAKLQSTEQTKDRGIVTTWITPDPIDFVYKFYQQELTAKQWQIVTQPSDNEPQLVAKQSQATKPLEARLAPQISTDKPQTGITVYTIGLLGASNTSTFTPTPTPTSSPTATAPPTVSNQPSSSLPTATADYLADLTQLGVLTSADKTPRIDRVVKRGEYSRWLVAAYNRINSTKPTQQLKLATTDTKPTFQDIPATHPDFPSIQGLAEAGLIPSPLSGDATAVLFRPDAPLTREQMILWKIPLDTRQPLPVASLDAVKQTWGFQDAGKIEPKALRAVLADFQNGEQSNIRRIFGYTTLFQPKKTVNVGEVAISIWYFGANSDGLSARDALQAVK